MGKILLALDYGGTKLSAAITAPGSREWLGLARIQSPPNHDARYEQAAMLGLARQLLDGRVPGAIGVSFGGPVDAARGVVLLSHHIPGWENNFLREELQKELGAPVSVDNDANVAALGEYEFGAGLVGAKHASPLLYVTVSTGVGGGWILNGEIFHGADAMAGEIGHTVVDPRGPGCVCGRRGCVEAMACGPAIARAARDRLGDVTAVDVARMANAGDLIAQEILDEAAHALGFGIGTALTLMNPERVVLGGGVTKSGERWWRGVRAAARANTLPQIRADIVPAALGDDAPLWGAIVLAGKTGEAK